MREARSPRKALAVALALVALDSSHPTGASPIAATPPKTISSTDLAGLLDPVFERGMEDERIPGAAFALVADGRIVWSRGYGVIDAETRAPVSPGSTRWPFASITKVVTATAVVQLAERDRVRLDADANDFLRSVRVPATYAAPVTVADLLRHTDGFDEIPGRLAPNREAVQPLREFLRGRLLRVAPPGGITRYGSYGIALAGLLVEDVTGVPYADYVRTEILAPLGMTRSSIGVPAGAEASLATPYADEDGQTRAIAPEWYHTPPTSSLVGTVEDMARFAIAHLDDAGGGAGILGPAARRRMQEQHATVHPAMPGWGLGWQLDDANGLRVLEHGGDIGGFAALVVLVPDERVGFVVVHHLEGSTLRFAVKRAILDRYFPDRRALHAPKPSPTASAERARRFAGEYLANNYCRSCPGGAASAQRFAVEALPDGTLRLWDTRWIETAPLLFVSEDGKRRIGFREDESGRIVAISAGSWKVLERSP